MICVLLSGTVTAVAVVAVAMRVAAATVVSPAVAAEEIVIALGMAVIVVAVVAVVVWDLEVILAPLWQQLKQQQLKQVWIAGQAGATVEREGCHPRRQS
jgi:hypothetical protein